MAAQLSAVTATRGVAMKAPRVTAKKARVATRVQAVRPREPRTRAVAENLVHSARIIHQCPRAVPTPES